VKAERSEAEMVGGFQMTVAVSEPTPESQARWERRADTLAKWLLSEWERERVNKPVSPKT